MIARSTAPANTAASSPVTAIQMIGSAIAARIEAMKANESGVSSHGQRSTAHGACWNKASATTIVASPESRNPTRSAIAPRV